MIFMSSSSCFPVRKSKDGKQNVLQEFRNLDLALNVLLVCFPGLSSNLPRIRHQSDTVYQGENRAEKKRDKNRNLRGYIWQEAFKDLPFITPKTIDNFSRG